MPQITLEYTDNVKPINFNSLFCDLHQTIHRIADVDIENCKSRAKKLECYFIGADNQNKAFVSMDLYLLEGRSLEVKQKLGEEVLKLLQNYFQDSIQTLDLQITVKIGDILRDTYFKYPAGTFTKMQK